ncbi:MAG: TetR/AcrR family transcriptional regulator [Myxococcota bacterium]
MEFNIVKLKRVAKKKKLRVGQHHGDLRRVLLAAAIRILSRGKERPSLREVARAAGVSQAAPYHHFGSRNGLMAAVACAGFGELEDVLLAAASRTRDPVQRVARMSEAYVEFALEHPQHYRVMFDPELVPDDDELERVARRVFGHLVEAVSAAVPDERLSVARARQVFALAHGTVDLAGSDALAKLGGPSSPRDVAREVASATAALLRSHS